MDQPFPALLSLNAPSADNCCLDLPAEFGRRFLIFVDTEEEFEWSKPLSRAGHGTRAAEAIPEFQARMTAAGVKPVYLAGYPMVTNSKSAAILKELQDTGLCTVGAHLHPWVTPPHEEELTGPNSFAGNLPFTLERAKLERLTDMIEQVFGTRPLIYRAGRYGIGEHTAHTLIELGYRIDTSIRPHFNYRAEGGPDFTLMNPAPFAICSGALIEIPLTTAMVGPLRKSEHWRAFLTRAGLVRRVPLTPEGTSLSNAKRAIDALLAEGLKIFNVSLHSPSLQPGHTPYVRDQSDLRRLYRWIGEIINHFAKRGIEPASVEQVINAVDSRRQETGRTSIFRKASAPCL